MTRQTPRAGKPTPRIKPAQCVFAKGFVTEVIDKKVDDLWKAGLGGKTPFGDLRNMFRRHHCRTINPYGDSDRCPFEKKECALAFLEAVQLTVTARPHTPVGYFIRVAKSTAAIRADEGVERRAATARLRRTDVHPVPVPDAYAPPSQETTSPDPRGVGAATRVRDLEGPGGGSRRDDRPGDPARLPTDPLRGMGHGPLGGGLLGHVETRSRERRPATGSEG